MSSNEFIERTVIQIQGDTYRIYVLAMFSVILLTILTGSVFCVLMDIKHNSSHLQKNEAIENPNETSDTITPDFSLTSCKTAVTNFEHRILTDR